MSKDRLNQTKQQRSGPRFIDFWRLIGSHLGSAHLRINPVAESINTIFDPNSAPPGFLKTVIEKSYRRCRCYHLKAELDVNHLLDILGETAYQLQQQQVDDLLDIEVLEEIAWLISERFASDIKLPEAVYTSREHESKTPVISLNNVKIQRANQRKL